MPLMADELQSLTVTIDLATVEKQLLPVQSEHLY